MKIRNDDPHLAVKVRTKWTGPQIPKHVRTWYRDMMAAFNKALGVGPRYANTRQRRRFLARRKAAR